MIVSLLEMGKLTYDEISSAAKASLNYVKKLAKTIKKLGTEPKLRH
jgi:hypothetical protein